MTTERELLSDVMTGKLVGRASSSAWSSMIVAALVILLLLGMGLYYSAHSEGASAELGRTWQEKAKRNDGTWTDDIMRKAELDNRRKLVWPLCGLMAFLVAWGGYEALGKFLFLKRVLRVVSFLGTPQGLEELHRLNAEMSAASNVSSEQETSEPVK